MAKYTQEVLLQMDLFKYPFDISSCVSNRHLKLNMSQVKLLIFPPNPALFAILLSIYGNSTPLPGKRDSESVCGFSSPQGFGEATLVYGQQHGLLAEFPLL